MRAVIDWIRETTGTAGRAAPAGVAIVAVALLWFSFADHPLYSPDEGRYGSVSRTMAEGGSLLVPQFRGHPHLTKPPLAYWAQALCLRLMGPSEAALRLPSLLAGSLTMLLVYFAGKRLRGPRVGILAVGMLSIMPLFLSINRLAITDPLLEFFWFAILLTGYMAAESGGRRWPILMWAALALALMTKGPIALIPFGVLILWLGLAGRWRMVMALRPWFGLPLALAPLLAWVGLILARLPDAMAIWKHEIVDRATGDGAHTEPIWYYLPAFMIGCFPATAMLAVPWWNLSWTATWRKLRSGDGAALWVLAVVVPLIILSLNEGKLPSYLLPTCPPLAILTALTLEGWIRRELDAPVPGTRPPEVVATVTICTALTIALAFIASTRQDLVRPWMILPWLLCPIACGWMWWIWKRRPQQRAAALMAAWLSFVVGWAWVFELEDQIRGPSSAATLVERLRQITQSPKPAIITLGVSDPTLAFYSGRDLTRIDTATELKAAVAKQSHDAILLADALDWDKFVQSSRDTRGEFVVVGEWDRWLHKPTLLLRPAGAAASASSSTSP